MLIQDDPRVKDLEGPVYISHINIDGKTIEFIGEIHSLPFGNDYYEAIVNYDLLDGKEIWCEHAVKYCQLRSGEEPLFKDVGGSEYIWLNSQGDVTCYDIRIARGLPSAKEEMNIKRDIKRLIYSEQFLRDFNGYVVKVLTNLSSLRPLFQEHDNIFKSYVIAIRDQYKQYLLLEDKTLDEAFKLLEKIYKNCVSICSIVVDMYLLEMIQQSNDRHIVIFGGANHGIRISELLKSNVKSEQLDERIYPFISEQPPTLFPIL